MFSAKQNTRLSLCKFENTPTSMLSEGLNTLNTSNQREAKLELTTKTNYHNGL
jgi:hypothetical protein